MCVCVCVYIRVVVIDSLQLTVCKLFLFSGLIRVRRRLFLRVWSRVRQWTMCESRRLWMCVYTSRRRRNLYRGASYKSAHKECLSQSQIHWRMQDLVMERWAEQSLHCSETLNYIYSESPKVRCNSLRQMIVVNEYLYSHLLMINPLLPQMNE